MTMQEQVDKAVRALIKSLMLGRMYGSASPARGQSVDSGRDSRDIHARIPAQLARVNSMPLDELPLLIAGMSPEYIVSKMAVHRVNTGEDIPMPSSLETMFPGLFVEVENRYASAVQPTVHNCLVQADAKLDFKAAEAVAAAYFSRTMTAVPGYKKQK